jgi:hypothetical protein
MIVLLDRVSYGWSYFHSLPEISHSMPFLLLRFHWEIRCYFDWFFNMLFVFFFLSHPSIFFLSPLCLSF